MAVCELGENKFIEWIRQQGGVAVIDDKRANTPAVLRAVGSENGSELVINTGPNGGEIYSISYQDAVEKLLTTLFIQSGIKD